MPNGGRPPAQEIIGRTLAPEGARPIATPEQQRAQEEARALRERMTEQAQRRREEERPLEALRPVVERRVEVDIEAGVRSRIRETNVDRLNRSEEAPNLARRIGEGVDWDAFTPDELDNILNQINSRVIERIPFLAALSPDAKLAVVEGDILTEELRDKVKTLLESRLGPQEIPEALQLAQAERERNESTRQLAALGIDPGDTGVELARARRELDEFNETTEGGLEGTRFAELQRLKASRTRFDEINTLLGKTEAELVALKAEVERKRAAGEAIAGDDEDLTGQLIDLEPDLTNLETLRRERGDLERRRDVTERFLTTERNHTNATDQKTAQEDRFTVDMENLVGDAVVELWEDRVTEANTAYREQLAQERGAAKNEFDNKIIDAMENRWCRYIPRGRHLQRQVNHLRLNNDFRGLLTHLATGGEVTLLRQVLTDGVAPGSPELQRVEQFLSENPDWVRDKSRELAGTLIAERMRSGPLHEGEIIAMVGTETGRDIMEKAITRRQYVVDKLQDLEAKGILPKGPGGYLDRLQRRFGGNWLMMLLLLLGGMVGASGLVTNRLLAGEGALARA